MLCLLVSMFNVLSRGMGLCFKMLSEFIVSLSKKDTSNYDIFSVSCTYKRLEILPIDKIFIDRSDL